MAPDNTNSYGEGSTMNTESMSSFTTERDVPGTGDQPQSNSTTSTMSSLSYATTKKEEISAKLSELEERRTELTSQMMQQMMSIQSAASEDLLQEHAETGKELAKLQRELRHYQKRLTDVLELEQMQQVLLKQKNEQLGAIRAGSLKWMEHLVEEHAELSMTLELNKQQWRDQGNRLQEAEDRVKKMELECLEKDNRIAELKARNEYLSTKVQSLSNSTQRERSNSFGDDSQRAQIRSFKSELDAQNAKLKMRLRSLSPKPTSKKYTDGKETIIHSNNPRPSPLSSMYQDIPERTRSLDITPKISLPSIEPETSQEPTLSNGKEEIAPPKPPLTAEEKIRAFDEDNRKKLKSGISASTHSVKSLDGDDETDIKDSFERAVSRLKANSSGTTSTSQVVNKDSSSRSSNTGSKEQNKNDIETSESTADTQSQENTSQRPGMEREESFLAENASDENVLEAVNSMHRIEEKIREHEAEMCGTKKPSKLQEQEDSAKDTADGIVAVVPAMDSLRRMEERIRAENAKINGAAAQAPNSTRQRSTGQNQLRMSGAEPPPEPAEIETPRSSRRMVASEELRSLGAELPIDASEPDQGDSNNVESRGSVSMSPLPVIEGSSTRSLSSPRSSARMMSPRVRASRRWRRRERLENEKLYSSGMPTLEGDDDGATGEGTAATEDPEPLRPGAVSVPGVGGASAARAASFDNLAQEEDGLATVSSGAGFSSSMASVSEFSESHNADLSSKGEKQHLVTAFLVEDDNEGQREIEERERVLQERERDLELQRQALARGTFQSFASQGSAVVAAEVVNVAGGQSGPTKTPQIDFDEAEQDLGPGPMRFADVSERPLRHQISELSNRDLVCFENLYQRWNERRQKKQAYEMSEQMILRFARNTCHKDGSFVEQRAWKSMKGVKERHLRLNAFALESQLLTKTLFPLPGLLSTSGHEMFYMKPSRYNPSDTPARTIIDNLVYVMNTMLARERPCRDGIGFLACMDDWKMKNFEVNYCYQFMMTLQAFTVPVTVQLFLIVNPPSWFGVIWRIMKPMLAPSFRKKVKVIKERMLHKYLKEGFENYLPDDLSCGRENTEALVRDFIAWRKCAEGQFLEEGSRVSYRSMPSYSISESVSVSSHSSSVKLARRPSLSSYSSMSHAGSSQHGDGDDDASIHCDIENDDSIDWH